LAKVGDNSAPFRSFGGQDLRVADVRRSIGGAGQINTPPESGRTVAQISDSIFKKPTVARPSLRANGSRECAPDDRLSEAIHRAAQRKMDCFVAALLAMTWRQIQM
jgi:hypothetical protein